MEQLWTVLLLLLVSICWGITNPWMKKASEGIENIRGSSFYCQIWNELCFLTGKASYVSAFLVNQLGGLLFVYCLGICDLSLAVPFTNSMALLITTLTGQLLDEEPISKRLWVGFALVCVGISLCVYDKAQSTA